MIMIHLWCIKSQPEQTWIFFVKHTLLRWTWILQLPGPVDQKIPRDKQVLRGPPHSEGENLRKNKYNQNYLHN